MYQKQYAWDHNISWRLVSDLLILKQINLKTKRKWVCRGITAVKTASPNTLSGINRRRSLSQLKLKSLCVSLSCSRALRVKIYFRLSNRLTPDVRIAFARNSNHKNNKQMRVGARNLQLEKHFGEKAISVVHLGGMKTGKCLKPR